MTLICWLRRDIRLHDNAALTQARRQSNGAVIPVFILDRRILSASSTGAARVHFLMEALKHLDEQLRNHGTRLIIREGEPVEELLKLCRETGAQGVFFNRDYEPYARQRDGRVVQALRQAGLLVESFKDRLIVEPDELRTAEGKPFTIYTPYRRRWLARLEEDPVLCADQGISADTSSGELQFQPVAEDVHSLPIPSGAELGFQTSQALPEASEVAAQHLLHSFVQRGDRGLREYHHQRNNVGIEATSRLAPHLRHGTLSPRAPVRAALQLRDRSEDPDVRKACETWLGELAWRDFYTAIMYHFPHVLERPYRDLFVDFPYRDAPDDLEAWQQGRTGYPLVDAGMRQLSTEGFMHNRARLNTAAFLVKHLLIDYRAGEQYFLLQLACGDYAVNNGNWQWVAGSSNDPQPYFRVFNPVTQGETYDPDGSYVRRYVPELTHVPSKYIHAPWTMPTSVAEKAGVKIGHDYPYPIVEHKAARERALAVFRQHRAEHGEAQGDEEE